MKNNENGRSMVEMLGVLAIIGVLSAGGLAGYSKAMFKHKLNTTMDQITMLVTNIRTAYGSQGSYSSLSVAGARKLGAIPAVMGTSDTLTNPFKGSVTLNGSAVAAEGGATGTAFTVSYAGLPTEACIALATADFGSGAGSGFIGVVVGTAAEGTNNDVYIAQGSGRTAITAGTNQRPEASGRGEGEAYTMAAAITACKATNNNATITWKFY